MVKRQAPGTWLPLKLKRGSDSSRLLPSFRRCANEAHEETDAARALPYMGPERYSLFLCSMLVASPASATSSAIPSRPGG